MRLTEQQKSARKAWRKAKADYRTATSGQRTKARIAYENSATAVLDADNAARKARRVAA